MNKLINYCLYSTMKYRVLPFCYYFSLHLCHSFFSLFFSRLCHSLPFFIIILLFLLCYSHPLLFFLVLHSLSLFILVSFFFSSSTSFVTYSSSSSFSIFLHHVPFLSFRPIFFFLNFLY